MDWRIPLADLDYGPEEEQAVLGVLRSRWLTMGAVTQHFEQAFAEFVGARHAIAVSNATAGLHLACLTLDLKPDDEVILPALTFVATAAAVRYVGAIPIFADIQSETDLTISPASIEQRITPRTKAIIVMHYGGYACDMPAIEKIAQKHNLALIEDAAHAPGAALDGRKMGVWGDAGVFSFFSNKNLSTGEGGMLVTNNDALAEKVRCLRSHAMTSLTWDRHRGHAWSYDVTDLGYNYRPSEIISALGLVQLQKLEKNNQRRRELTACYHRLLEEKCPVVTLPFRLHCGVSACHILPVLLPEQVERARFMASMKSNGIQTSIHYPPVSDFSFYCASSFGQGVLPLTRHVASREVTLPMYPTLTLKDVEIVVAAVGRALNESLKVS
ncbi:MAG: DegT/DnrJ/EryC1/StrS aminotransferase family protein [Anaerolineales bacterium]